MYHTPTPAAFIDSLMTLKFSLSFSSLSNSPSVRLYLSVCPAGRRLSFCLSACPPLFVRASRTSDSGVHSEPRPLLPDAVVVMGSHSLDNRGQDVAALKAPVHLHVKVLLIDRCIHGWPTPPRRHTDVRETEMAERKKHTQLVKRRQWLVRR